MMTVNQSPQPMRPVEETLATYISVPRLAPYLTAANDNHRQALQLYNWNISLSGAVYEALHFFEVVLRNAMDIQLCRWNATQLTDNSGQKHSEDWLLDPAPLLRRLTRSGQDIATATARAQTATRRRKNHPMGHADILAQLSFGTWRFLLPNKDPGRQLLWANALNQAFPNLNRPEHELVSAVAGINQLRNRVAHLEPLLKTSDVRLQYNNMREILTEINPLLEQSFISTQRITAILRAKP